MSIGIPAEPGGEPPQGEWGCVIIGCLLSLLVVCCLVGFAIYVIDQMEAGWQIPQTP
jgi:hypothetical protein